MPQHGKRIKSGYAEGNLISQNTYDSIGQLLSNTDALGNTTGYEYDIMGNIQKITECLNRTEEAENIYTYDAGSRLISAADSAGNQVSQTFDSMGNTAAVTDAMGGTTSYSYDSMQRITEIINAIGAKESYTYNAEGLLEETENNAGQKTTYTYDAAGRIIRQKDEEGTISYTYDKNSNVLTVSDKNGTISRTYDALNRITGVTDYNGDTITYGYDELGNRISITYPGGEKVRYTYDKAGNLLTVTDAQGSVTYYSYDKNGRLTETTRGDGSRETRSYDAAGQLTGLKDETAAGEIIHDYGYTYDGRGNILKITGMDAGISADMTAENTVSVAMTYDADNRLLTYNGQTVEYDKVGNMIKGPLNGEMAELTYDCRNRLTKVKEADGTVTSYEYDAENVRTASITNGIRTEYTTDRESSYSQTLVRSRYEKSFLGKYTKEAGKTTYTYGLGLISERRDEGEEFYYHYNHIGSTMEVSDAAGNIIYRFAYDTYGELSDITTADGISLKTLEGWEKTTEYTLAELAYAAGIDYLYNGQYGVMTDRNSLYYMRARYYNQDIKRFINRDVVSGNITNSQSLNRYCYVQGNPVSLTDPFGLCPDGNSLIGKLAQSAVGLAGIIGGQNPWESLREKISIYGHAALGLVGIFCDGADVINAIWYLAEGNTDMAIVSALCALPFVGSLVGGSGGLALEVIGRGFTLGLSLNNTYESGKRAITAYHDGNLSWGNILEVGLNALGTVGA